MPQQQNELVQLQREITNEVSRDAPHIATMVFGDNAAHPDMAQVSNQQLDELYRQKYQSEDRTWLQAEARRDPEQFMKVAQRIGVAIPPPQPPPAPAPAPMPMPVPSVAPVPAGLPPPAPVAAPQVLPLAPPQPLPPAPAALSMPPGLAPPPAQPPVILGPNGQPLPAMAGGGVVTQPTLALIGEAGPEAVVPLSDDQIPDPDLAARLGGAAVMQPPPYVPPMPDPDLAARLGDIPSADVTPPMPSHEEIAAYIQQAAAARGIDPNVALAVALHEGTNPRTGRFDSPAVEGAFTTGHSWWPYQLHYGGPGYEQYGTTAGLGNEFTRQTGWQPGDPRAWRDATDFALDVALQRGWYPTWYGSIPAKVAPRQGLPASAPARRA